MNSKPIEGTTLTSAQFADEFVERQIEWHQDPEKHRGLSYNHPDLDRITGGARKGEFIVLAASQKAGKTTAALAWALNFATRVQDDEYVLFVSLEMSMDGLGSRVFANLSGIDVNKFRDLKLKEGDWQEVEEAQLKLGDLPLLWNVGAYNLEGIEKVINDTEGKPRVILVDYMQLMSATNMDDKRWEQLETLSRGLKQLAGKYESTVIILSQQSRDALKSIDRMKDPNTIAGTQSVARDCDLMLMLLPYIEDGEEVPHMRKLHIAISRNSSAGITLDAMFSGSLSRFGALSKENINDIPVTKEEQQWEQTQLNV